MHLETPWESWRASQKKQRAAASHQASQPYRTALMGRKGAQDSWECSRYPSTTRCIGNYLCAHPNAERAQTPFMIIHYGLFMQSVQHRGRLLYRTLWSGSMLNSHHGSADLYGRSCPVIDLDAARCYCFHAYDFSLQPHIGASASVHACRQQSQTLKRILVLLRPAASKLTSRRPDLTN